MGNDQGGLLDLLDHLGNGISFPRPRSSQQHLGVESLLHPSGQGIDGFRLVSRRSKRSMDFKRHNGFSFFFQNLFHYIIRKKC